MQTIKSDILIIGAGLTGLSIAYMLRKEGKTVHLIEARERVGGRIHTLYNDNQAPQEMGATWLGKKHNSLLGFLEELKIEIFEQKFGDRAIYEPISTSPPQLVQLPPNTDPSFRIKGGTSTIINTLADSLNEEQILLEQAVQSLKEQENFISVKTKTHQFEAKKVISTLPPNLFVKTIDVSPNLPDSLVEVATNTHTWMGESIKIALTYEKPFWREKKLSGTIFSSVGPIPEMYDHSNYEDSHFALKGFFNGSYFSVTKEERLRLILNQLKKYFGDKAANFINYEEAIWRKEAFTFVDYSSHILPHQNNGHPVYQKSYMNDKLFIAGAETATAFPGYMEGAIRSARFVCERIKEVKF